MHHGDAEIDCGKGSPDVCRHVVVALAGVMEKWIAIWNQSGEEPFKVPTDFGVGILLNHQRGGRVLQMQRDQPGLKTALADEFGHLVGELVEAASARADDDLVNGLSHGGVYLPLSIFSKSAFAAQPAAMAFW